MAGDDPAEPDDKSTTTDECEEFRDGEPIRLAEFTAWTSRTCQRTSVSRSSTTIFRRRRYGAQAIGLICEIQEHLYTKGMETARTGGGKEVQKFH